MKHRKKRYWWLIEMIASNNYMIGAEIGCANGATTHRLLQYRRGLRLYAVDKWEKVDGGYEAGELGARTVKPGSNCTGWDPVRGWERFNQCTRPYSKRLTILRGDSVEMAKRVEDASLDFVFIDADHRYPAVVKDIAAWVPKLKEGGMLCGHDIHLPGVHQAVEEALTDYVDTGVDHVWYAKKEDYAN